MMMVADRPYLFSHIQMNSNPKVDLESNFNTDDYVLPKVQLRIKAEDELIPQILDEEVKEEMRKIFGAKRVTTKLIKYALEHPHEVGEYIHQKLLDTYRDIIDFSEEYYGVIEMNVVVDFSEVIDPHVYIEFDSFNKRYYPIIKDLIDKIITYWEFVKAPEQKINIDEVDMDDSTLIMKFTLPFAEKNLIETFISEIEQAVKLRVGMDFMKRKIFSEDLNEVEKKVVDIEVVVKKHYI